MDHHRGIRTTNSIENFALEIAKINVREQQIDYIINDKARKELCVGSEFLKIISTYAYFMPWFFAAKKDIPR